MCAIVCTHEVGAALDPLSLFHIPLEHAHEARAFGVALALVSTDREDTAVATARDSQPVSATQPLPRRTGPLGRTG